MAKKKVRSTRRKTPARARPKSRSKTLFRPATRAHIASLTPMMIEGALQRHSNSKTYAAHSLGISPRTLQRLRKDLLAQREAVQQAAAPPSAPPPSPASADSDLPPGTVPDAGWPSSR